MSNKQLFAGKRASLVPNAAGGKALNPGAEHGLAQMAVSCTLADSFYTSGEAQLKEVLALCEGASSEYIAKLAVYARYQGMKDMPCLLLTHLTNRDDARGLVNSIFPVIIHNGRMLRNFFQMTRSGLFGRRSFNGQTQRLMQSWFRNRTADQVFENSVGSDPSMKDVLRLVRPTPKTDEQSAMLAYLVDKGEPVGKAAALRAWAQHEGEMPQLPFEFLAGAAKDSKHWEQIARNLSFVATVKNLNTFARHEISKEAWKIVSERLRGEVPKMMFPYNLFTAYRFSEANPQIPAHVKESLQVALDNSLQNVPEFSGRVAVAVDISGSMQSPVTGYRPGATGVTMCSDVAALFASAILRKNPEAIMMTFDTHAKLEHINPRDSVITNAKVLARHGGGTDCGSPLRLLAKENIAPDLVVILSDNQSWWGNEYNSGYGARSKTTVESGWAPLRKLNPVAKLVCMDLQANPTVQILDGKDSLNIGGFSDSVFGLVKDFAAGNLSAARWVEAIKATKLP